MYRGFFQDVAFHVQGSDFPFQLGNLRILRLLLPIAREGVRRIGALLSNPVAEHIGVNRQIAYGLRGGYLTLEHESDRLHLKLSTELPSL